MQNNFALKFVKIFIVENYQKKKKAVLIIIIIIILFLYLENI